MFDIIFQATSRPFDGTNIILSSLAGNLTIFAFGFPYIYRAINNLSKISNILTGRIKNKRWRIFYPWFLIVVFILNAVCLIWHTYKVFSIISIIFLLIHIVYVMNIYQIIENSILNPFAEIENNNISELDIKLKNKIELENDIVLVTDLICYYEKNSFNEPDLNKYFSWLIDITFLKFKEYNISNFDCFWGILPKEQDLLYSTLYKVYWLNRWAVNEKKIVSLDYIDNFYSWILEYGLVHPNDFNDKMHTILKSINSIDDLKKDYFDASDDIAKDRIKKHCDFIERIQSDVLEQKKQTSLYRINNKFISNSEIYYFVELLYYTLSRKFKSKQDEKYEPCFSLISSMIDNNIFDKYYTQIIERIKKHHKYLPGRDNIYNDICGFHINIMAYLIYRNQYQLLKDYIYYEEPPERITQYTRPQIPNTIDNILFNFIGNNSVFYNTQTFSSNVSSYKYKFYILFIMLLNSKNFAEKCKENLSKIKKTDWQYNFIEADFKRHNECSIDFNNIYFDNLMSFISVENYKKYLNEFKLETELLNVFECNDNDLIFIEEILDDTIKKIKKAQTNLLKRKFEDVVNLDFSSYKQKELKVKNLSELINIKINLIYKSLEKMSFSYVDNSSSHDLYLNLYDKTYNKRQILSGRYQYIFDREPMNDFYSRLFNILIENCQKVPSVENIPDDIKDNYQIFSNFARRQAFVSFGFKRENIKVKTCIVNGKKDDNSEFADVDLIKINNVNIKISEYNYHFNTLNENGTYPHTIILFDSNKISIEVGEGQPIKFINAKNGNVQIIDNTQIKIKIPNDKNLGYCIVKEQHKQD